MVSESYESSQTANWLKPIKILFSIHPRAGKLAGNLANAPVLPTLLTLALQSLVCHHMLTFRELWQDMWRQARILERVMSFALALEHGKDRRGSMPRHTTQSWAAPRRLVSTRIRLCRWILCPTLSKFPALWRSLPCQWTHAHRSVGSVRRYGWSVVLWHA